MVAVGPTAIEVNVGSTKKPLQPTIIANKKSVTNAARICSFFLQLSILAKPQSTAGVF
jgi:hypothetical protein